MSNKTLSITLAIIIILFAGSVAFFRMRGSSNQDNFQADDIKNYTQGNSQENQMENNGQEQQASVTPTPASTGTVAGDEVGKCVRNFDENKLKNDKVSISGRQVEINVKDFGVIKVEFYEKDSPKTVENFLRLTNSGYYNCITFHRVSKGFVIQGGDPTGTGTGGDSAFGGKFADETNANSDLYKTGYKKGILAMANAGPNTNTSQFFIMLGDVPLPPNYTIFGHVVSGIDVVEKIGKVDIIPQMSANDGAPKTPVIMQSVKIVK